ncbi:MAG: SGNH/GDSL hydrolase family protein [Victivallaceae bacterium]|nr:SGNH/GDSL hydrolase family protein [Victivallaceae bacterium]
MNTEINVLKLDKNMTVESVDENGLVWLNPNQSPFKLVGFYWFGQDKVYRRFPVNPDPVLPAGVEALSNCTAGGQIKFRTNSKRIAVKVKLASLPSMDHMPDTGSSGFDIYAGEPGRQTFCGVTRSAPRSADYSHEFVFPENLMREITLNFPLYNGVKKLSVGLDENAAIAPPEPFVSDSPLVVYGTSITQGGCASHPGMCYSNILSRKLNRPFINLGFSGNGKGEPEVAEHISRIKDPAMFILDYEANVLPGQMAETLPGFVRILRGKHPTTPILVVSKVAYAGEVFDREAKNRRESSKKIELENVEKFRAAGDKNVHFIDAGFFQGEDFWECTVDGVHPTDLGFYRMAENLLPEIAKRL